MKIFDHFQHITLTSDQAAALEKLQRFLDGDERAFILQGYAGSGKTTLIKGLVAYLQAVSRRYQLMAPTGRAAKVIHQKTGHGATTIHKGIYSLENLREIKEENHEIGFLYEYQIRNNPDIHNAVLIIDEASMVSDVENQGEFFRFGSGYLLQDLITYARIQDAGTTSKIIFVGDPAQLPPIGMNFSPALDPVYLSEHYQIGAETVGMKEIKRQDNKPGILQAANKLRQCLTAGYFNDFDLRANGIDLFNPSYQEYYDIYKTCQEAKIIICHQNKTAQEINRAIRNDRFQTEDPCIQPGDTVIIGGNNYLLGIMNGEFAVVTTAEPVTISREIRYLGKGGQHQSVRLTWRYVELAFPDEQGQQKNISGYMLENYLYGDTKLKPEEQQALYIDFKNRHPELRPRTEEFKEAIMRDAFFHCILLKYGYAVTCHKAQGGEWGAAFVFWDRGVKDGFDFYTASHDRRGKTNAEFYRWAYTAVTRAARFLYCINPPHFTSFSGMTFVGAITQESLGALSKPLAPAIEIDIGTLVPELQPFGLMEASLRIQDHFIVRYHLLRKQYIDIINWKRKGYEIHYFFRRIDQTAAMKYWVNADDVFNPTFQKIPAETNSEELYETIVKLLADAPAIVVNRHNVEGVLTHIAFEISIEEERPFLRYLYDAIRMNLGGKERISNLEHYEYRERYTLALDEGECVFDFEYDKAGFFGRVVPLERRCTNPLLLGRVRELIQVLKTEHYVV